MSKKDQVSLQSASRALLLSVLLTSLVQAGQESDPFSPGLRWSRNSGSSAAWIPGKVRFTGEDQLVWAASGDFGAQIEAYSAWGDGQQLPMWAAEGFAPGALISDVASGSEASSFFALVRTQVAGVAADTLELSCYAGPSLSAGAGAGPLWSVTGQAGLTGAALLACDEDAERVCFATSNFQNKQVSLRWHAGVDGAILAETSISVGEVDRLVMSADGRLTLCAAGERVWVWDSLGSLVHYEALSSELRFADFTANGDELLLAHGNRARLMSRSSGGFLEILRVDGGVGELAACGAISGSGEGWSIAWCDVGAGSARYELYAGLSATLSAQYVQPIGAQGLQNIPQTTCITQDGERAVFATWGGGEASEVLLLDAATGGLYWSLDLPGSATDVALDRAGRRIAVTHKSVHANQPSASGEVRLYDTGESDLILAEAPRPGGTLRVEAKLDQAGFVFFLFGESVNTSQMLPFVQGELWVSLQSRLVVRARRVDESGTARCALGLPLSLEGLALSIQAVGRVGAGLVASETHLDLVVR